MNYAGFTRPLWSWLRADELALPDFLGVPGGVPAAAGADVGGHHAGLRRAAVVAVAGQLVDPARLARHRPDPDRRRRSGPGRGGGRPADDACRAYRWSSPATRSAWQGVNGEDARRPMPWHRPETLGPGHAGALPGADRGCDASTRRCATAGCAGPTSDDDALRFLRETAGRAAAGAGPPRGRGAGRAGGLRARRPTNVYGGAAAPCDDRRLGACCRPTVPRCRSGDLQLTVELACGRATMTAMTVSAPGPATP